MTIYGASFNTMCALFNQPIANPRLQATNLKSKQLKNWPFMRLFKEIPSVLEFPKL
jgi:hypothetical protein